MPDASLSVLVITRGRPGLLRDCLRAAAAPGGPEELLVGVNGADAESLEAARAFGHPVRAVQLPRMCRGEARNALAALARGRWLCFLDDDTVPPAGYFGRLRELIAAYPGAAVFGGGQLLSDEAGPFERAVFHLLASPFGGGPFTERFSPVSGSAAAGPEKFILCNLAVDGDFLREKGLAFEGHLSSAEENLLLSKMSAAGAGMVLSGKLNLVHRRRSGLPGFAKQVFSCGRGRGQITALSARGFCAFTLLPPAGLAAFCAAAAFFPAEAAIAAGAYAGLAAAAAAFSPAPARLKPALAALFPVLHAAYAAGWLYGAAEGLAGKVFRRARPARCLCEGNT